MAESVTKYTLMVDRGVCRFQESPGQHADSSFRFSLNAQGEPLLQVLQKFAGTKPFALDSLLPQLALAARYDRLQALLQGSTVR